MSEIKTGMKAELITVLHACCACFVCRLKTQISSNYGLKSQPRLVDIIAAVPNEYKKVSTYIVHI